jgi:hypothetical protein
MHKAYNNLNWFKFSEQVQKRDNYTCLKCGRKKGEVILQTHHKSYKYGLELWNYALSDCITLCKGCHANEHYLVEPTSGWNLISIDDLEDMTGTCERKGCGHPIRYEHLIYHPSWGYQVVGSTCVEYLTIEDQYLSKEIIKIFNKISDFIKHSDWNIAYTKNEKRYIYTKHLNHIIRIYGKTDKYYSYQIIIKNKGSKWVDFKDPILIKNKPLLQIKELAFIVLKGTITEDIREKEILRNIYKKIK